MDWYHRQAAAPLEDRLKQQLEDRLQNDAEYLALFISTLAGELQKMIFKRRLYCLTPDPACTLMWSHYAENHSGICLEFSTDIPMFGNAMKVNYSMNCPLWLQNLTEKIGLEMVLTKAKSWEYEREFRVWTVGEGSPSPYLSPQGNFLALPDGALTSIIAGCVADYDAIRAIVDAHMPSLPVKRAVKVDHKFELQIADA